MIDRRRVAPLMLLAVASLACGIWAGLERIGWDLPGRPVDVIALHGPLMVIGFLSTVIGLERAAALGAAWSFVAPAGAVVGTALLLASAPASLGRAVVVVSAATLTLALVQLGRRAWSFAAVVLVVASASLVVGDALWLAGSSVTEVAPWWTGFLVLTIVGERLELAALTLPGRWTMLALRSLLVVYVVGIALTHADTDVGRRVMGVALVAIALWLARWDVARRTVRIRGLPRFVAVALLAGYGWLAFAGLVDLVRGDAPGLAVDASTHAIFLGFVFSMIFAHAPIVFPALLGVAVPFRRLYYLHLALLHVGLVVRAVAALAGDSDALRAGGLLNAAAIGAFLLVTAVSVVLARRGRTRPVGVSG